MKKVTLILVALVLLLVEGHSQRLQYGVVCDDTMLVFCHTLAESDATGAGCVHECSPNEQHGIGDYECIDGTSYYYLDGGVIYVKPATGAGQAYYALTDHLGSYTRLYTMAGDSVLIASYDPWGNRTTTKNTLKFHRGFTGHEHLTTYGVINMNGRMYDPTVGRFLAPDNFVQMPDFSQSFNRYSYCLNNPLKYTDPSGEWLGIDDLLVAGLSFVAGYVSNGISSGDWGWSSVKTGLEAAGMAWLGYNTAGLATGTLSSQTMANIAKSGINTFVNNLMPTMTIPINDHFSFSVSPMFGWGDGGLSSGLGVSASYQNGDAWGFSVGIGQGSNYFGGMAGLNVSDWGFSYAYTSYSAGNFCGEQIMGQKVGTIGLSWRDVSFRLSNDKFGEKHKDRWRTSAAELSIGKFTVGTYVSTNYGANASNENMNNMDSDKLLGQNPTNKKGIGNAWRNGKVYSAPLWIGYRQGNQIQRIGYSHPYVQSLTQNAVHKYLVKTPFFLDYSEFKKGLFSYSGYNNPFTLWNY